MLFNRRGLSVGTVPVIGLQGGRSVKVLRKVNLVFAFLGIVLGIYLFFNQSNSSFIMLLIYTCFGLMLLLQGIQGVVEDRFKKFSYMHIGIAIMFFAMVVTEVIKGIS